MVGRMPSRKAPAIISVDAKICLLFPVGSWHLLDSPGTGQKLGTLYRGRGHNRASWLLRLRLRCRRQRLHAEHRMGRLGPTETDCRSGDLAAVVEKGCEVSR